MADPLAEGWLVRKMTFFRWIGAKNMQVGVFGSWDRDLAEDVYRIAEEVGELIAGRGDILFTGGSTGIMQAAMRGAKRQNGLTVGIIPVDKKEDYEFLADNIDVHIMTGMGEFGKVAPLVNSVDGAIAIAGGAGTLMEISMAYLQGKPIVAIPVEGYMSARLRAFLMNSYLDHRKIRRLFFAKDAPEAIELLYSQIDERHPFYRRTE